MERTPNVAAVVDALDTLYDPAWAMAWDAVGLVCGEPEAPVRRVLFAVDPVAAVVDEALGVDAQIVVTHHPLFLNGVHGVAATTAKGRLVHRLVASGVALHVAHTNADVAAPGVSDALAAAVGLRSVHPLQPAADEPTDKIVTFVPPSDVERVLDALTAAGAGTIGAYRRCAYLSDGTGTFLPGDQANPAIGTRGQVEVVPETRLEMELPRARRVRVVRALRDAHPYEEPAYDVYELAATPGGRGLGRVGDLDEETTLSGFVRRTAAALPATVWGVRATGHPTRPVRRVAVCGGSGGDLVADAARAGADVLVTADLRHHPASDAAEDGAVALVDAAHWATEWPWLQGAAGRLTEVLARQGTTVDTVVSRRVTDPWTLHESTPHEEHASQP